MSAPDALSATSEDLRAAREALADSECGRFGLAAMAENKEHVVRHADCVTCVTAAANLGVLISVLRNVHGWPHDETPEQALDAEERALTASAEEKAE